MNRHPTMRNTDPHAGFTVLEMLVIVLVLSVLFSFLLSAITTLRRDGEFKQARGEAVALAQALKEYRGIYGVWPGQRQGQTDRLYRGGDGEDCPTNVTEALLNNPRGVNLLPFADGNATNVWRLDPWGEPYMIVMDENADGYLQVAIPGQGMVDVTNETAGVIAQAPDGSLIFSWDARRKKP